ncbi:hypothetical protein, partial [uncultured Desulfovibrio sp.]|uniref:hypothetical protein n=1 Tax=uncultured Desulfovibrio sp. TaxID=167968 RepID=UPI00266F507F
FFVLNFRMAWRSNFSNIFKLGQHTLSRGKSVVFRSLGALVRLRGQQSIYLISSDKCSKPSQP